MEITAHKPGSFCTAVLRTRDLDRAAAFYGALVGWTGEYISGSFGHRLLQMGGKTVASVHQIAEGDDIWVPHVSVESVERTAAHAVSLGATVVDTIAIEGLARLATLRDLEGALIGLWQPAPHHGAQLMEDIGSVWWVEVLSNDAAGAREFYEKLFGWTAVEISLEPFDSYTVFKRGDVQEGGLLQIGRDWGLSPRWGPIFSVDECDVMLEHAKHLGGSPGFVHTVPRAGRIGSLEDPGGAVFVIRGPAT
jgi:predicted enzyme related to lactoylglutathione lyase